jgi:PAS domain S-box-containing protein
VDQVASMDDALHALGPALTILLALITDASGRVKSVSRGLCELLGMERDDIVERNVSDLRPSLRGSASLASMHDALRAGQDWHGLLTVRGADGRDHRVECLLTRVADVQQGCDVYAVIGHEVAIATSALHTNRLRMLGQVAAGVLHDLNNVLAAALGHVELARSHAQAGRLLRLANSLDEVTTAGELCRDIAGSLLDLLRGRPRAKQVCLRVWSGRRYPGAPNCACRLIPPLSVEASAPWPPSNACSISRLTHAMP